MWDTVENFFGADSSPLIPEQFPDQYGNFPRTIVLNFDHTIVRSLWTRRDGITLRKRPYLDEFLAILRECGYEVVVWSNAMGTEDQERCHIEVDPTMSLFRFHLFREHYNYNKGRFVKDLTRLRRNLERVIVIDHESSSILQQENALHIKSFEDDVNDRELLRVAKFLRDLDKYNIPDVRVAIAKYNKDPDSSLFVEEEAIWRKSQEDLQKQSGAPRASVTGGWLSKLSRKPPKPKS